MHRQKTSWKWSAASFLVLCRNMSGRCRDPGPSHSRAWQPGPLPWCQPGAGSWGALGQPQPWATGTSLGTGTGQGWAGTWAHGWVQPGGSQGRAVRTGMGWGQSWVSPQHIRACPQCSRETGPPRSCQFWADLSPWQDPALWALLNGTTVIISWRCTHVRRSFTQGPGRLPSVPSSGRCDVGPPFPVSSGPPMGGLLACGIWSMWRSLVTQGAQDNKYCAFCGRRLSPGTPTWVKTHIWKSRSFLGNYISGSFDRKHIFIFLIKRIKA